MLNEKRKAGKRILFEGAQGALLDIDFGTYPFVTSSNVIAGQAATGTGMGPGSIDFVLGIVKAYTTRVGEGPFPAELDDADGQRLGERGHEFGTVTGRKRRCGWFDAVLVRQTCATSGVNGIAFTKLDVLDGFETLKICVGYDLDGDRLDYLPTAADHQARCRPIYEEMPGWSQSTEGARSWADSAGRGNQIRTPRGRVDWLPCRPIVYLSGARGYDFGHRSVCRLMALTYKSRKRWALVILLIGLPVYIVVAVTVIGLLDRPGLPVELLVYVVLGVIWIVPFKFVFKGIGQADPERGDG